jgi:hypothetical protein
MTIFSDPLTASGGETLFAPFSCRPPATFAGDAPNAGAACYAAALADASPLLRLETEIGEALDSTRPVFLATLMLPGLGRFDIHVADERDGVRLRLRCHAARGRAWLVMHRSTIEQRLTFRLGRAVTLSAIAAGAPPTS